MDTHNNNNHPDKQPTLKEVREQRRLIQAQLELRQLEGARQILEAISNPDYYLTAYGDLLDRYRDGGRMAYPLTQPTDRRYGQNYPFWNTETDLSLLRAQARLLCTMNNYAIGLLNGLQAYVIGDGFQYRVVEKKKHGLSKGGKPSTLVAQTQDIIEEFCTINDWHHWEQELFWRSREDGEYFLRYYPDRQLRCLTLRSVEPEQVTTTGLPDPRPEWSFGILTEPEDMQEIYGYNVLYLSDPQNHQNEIREEVPAEQIQHFKINVHRLVKRGLTDFCFSTYDALRMAEKLRNNMAEGASVQSALAFLRQHESATQSQVQNFLNNQQLDFSRLNPLTGQAISYKHIEPGSIADIPRGMQYVQPPGAGNASGFVEILHASLRGAGCRWNAPEWLATGSGADMAAYTASLTAQAPFVRTAMQKQLSYKKAFTRVIKQAIATAVDFGRLPEEVFDLLDIQVEAPSIPYKSALDEAQANQIRVQGGWKSRQTVQQEEGLDPEREMRNIEEYNRRMDAAEKQRPMPVHEANFNPDEPRDERGRWTKVGGGAITHGVQPAVSYAPPATAQVVTALSSPVEQQPDQAGGNQANKASASQPHSPRGKNPQERLGERLRELFLKPDEYPWESDLRKLEFMVGILQGFVQDGFGGTVGGIADLLKGLFRYLTMSPVERAQRGLEAIKSGVDLANKFAEAARKLKDGPVKEALETFQALLEGDRDKLNQKVAQLSVEAAVAMNAALDVLAALAEAAIDLDPQTKGRIVGWVLYQVAETAATMGTAEAIKAGAFSKLISKLPDWMRESKIVSALEKVFAGLEETSSLFNRAPWTIGDWKKYREVGKPMIDQFEKEFIEGGGKIFRHSKPRAGMPAAGEYDPKANVIHLYPGHNIGTLAEELIHFKQAQSMGIVNKRKFLKHDRPFCEEKAAERLRMWGFTRQ